MILRKPFAILIKYFKLIHLVQSIMLGYLLNLTFNLYSFISSYLLSPSNLIDPSKTSELFSPFLFIIPVILIIVFSVTAALMKFKKKPILFYLFANLTLILSLIICAFSNSIIVQLEVKLVDIRTLKIVSDLVTTILMIQSVTFVLTLVRATGFDIKKFDFNKDLEDLQIEEDDNEEFELNVELEKGKWKRRFNKFIRLSKYTIKENKIAVASFTIVFIIVSGYLTYNYIYVVNKTYNEKENMTMGNVNIYVNKSYKTNYNVKNNSLEDISYVIANIDINKIYGRDDSITSSRIYLNVNGHNFYHDYQLQSDFFDLGTAYKDQIINDEIKNYNFIYKIPSSLYKHKKYIVYEDNEGKEYKIKLKTIELTLPEKVNDYKITENISFKDSLLLNTNLKIDSYQIENLFKQSYNYCPSLGFCYQSVSYVTPSLNTNYNKAVLKLSLNYTRDENISIQGTNKFINFINSFGKLCYTVGSKTYKYSNLKQIDTKVNDNNQYIEVNEDIKQATDIWFEIKIRDMEYKYILKQGEL